MTRPGEHRRTGKAMLLIPLAIGLCAVSWTVAAPPDTPRLTPPVVDARVPETKVTSEDEKDREKRASERPTEVRFRNGHVLGPPKGPGPADGQVFEGMHVLQFPGPVDRAARKVVEKLGVRVHDFVQGNALVVEVPPGASQGLLHLLRSGRLRRLERLPAEAKLARELATAGDTEQRVTVVFFRTPGDADLEALAGSMRIEQIDSGAVPSARGWLAAGRARAVADLDVVRWMEPYEPASLHNIEGTMSGGADAVAGIGAFTGAGVRVAIDDSGIARPGAASDCFIASFAYHPDLAGSRIADQWDFYHGDDNPCDDNGHGTHTAGTIGGDGSYKRDFTGVAPDATLLIYKDCCDSFNHGFGEFASLLARAAAHDAQVVANSWGGYNGVYMVDAYYADSAVRGTWNGSNGQPRRMVLTISSGNDNDLSASPGTGKNVITVGATKNGNWPADAFDCFKSPTCENGCDCDFGPLCGDNYQPESDRICFSNHGLIDTDGDGHTRIKPDLVAPGTNTMSAAPFYLLPGAPLYQLKSGTSMAQPVVAGTVALMLQAFPVLSQWPEALKAKLLATAVDLGDVTQYGHGMLDSFHAIYDADGLTTPLWVANATPGTGSELNYNFAVPAGFKEVRVDLTWSDPPSLSTEVVDDLDLRIYDGAGTLVGASVSFDDTVESVRLNGGTPGTWRASVRGYNVPDGSAQFGLAGVVVSQFPGVVTDAASVQACIRPGDPFVVSSTLSGSGAPAAAGEIILDLPDNSSQFSLEDATIQTNDPGRQHTYLASEMAHDAPSNRYSMTVGLVSPFVQRDVAWGLRAASGLLEGTYPLPMQGQAFGTFPYVTYPSVTVDTAPPGGVGALTSADHVEGFCSNDESVTMQWSPAGDGAGCGVTGYSVSWSAVAPATPDTTRDIGAVTDFTASLAQGASRYYFNIRAVDGIGNWSGTTQSWGPIKIDTTSPGYVTSLTSPTHPVNACTDQGSVQLQWAAAPDDNCGVAGYSISWSADVPEVPDTVRDIGAVQSVQTILMPSNARRYFNIRTVDNAGNWSVGSIPYGPLVVDTIPGAIANLMLAPAGGDLAFAWDARPDADFYRVYRDTNPAFLTATQIGRDLATNSLLQQDGLAGAEPIVYYRVLGTNVCGAPGP
jgi:serine protease AprX